MKEELWAECSTTTFEPQPEGVAGLVCCHGDTRQPGTKVSHDARAHTHTHTQHPEEECYKFATPSTMKPTQIRCSEGSVNQLPPWTEIQGDIRLTPFYEAEACLEKVMGYVASLNNGTVISIE